MNSEMRQLYAFQMLILIKNAYTETEHYLLKAISYA